MDILFGHQMLVTRGSMKQRAHNRSAEQQLAVDVRRLIARLRHSHCQQPNPGDRSDADTAAVDSGDPASAEFAPSNPFSISEISHYDSRGRLVLNNLAWASIPAPISPPCIGSPGQHYATLYRHDPCRRLLRGLRDRLYQRGLADESVLRWEVEHIQAWEQQNGRIPAGAWVLMRTGWVDALIRRLFST